MTSFFHQHLPWRVVDKLVCIDRLVLVWLIELHCVDISSVWVCRVLKGVWAMPAFEVGDMLRLCDFTLQGAEHLSLPINSRALFWKGVKLQRKFTPLGSLLVGT